MNDFRIFLLSVFMLDQCGIYQLDNTDTLVYGFSHGILYKSKLLADNMETYVLIAVCETECCLLLIFTCNSFPYEILRKINKSISTEYGELFFFLRTQTHF